MGTIRFELRNEKKDTKGKAPVRMIYQVKGQRKYYNTGIKVFSENWDSDSQKSIYIDRKTAKKLLPNIDYALLLSDKEAQEINTKLLNLKHQVQFVEKRFELDNIPYTSDLVIEKLKEAKTPVSKKSLPTKLLFDFIDKYIEDHSATREPGSLIVYKSLKNHLQDYQRYSNKKVTFENIDYSFFQSFQKFLISPVGTTINKKGEQEPRKPINNITAAKQLSTIKTFLNYAKKQGITISDRYKDFKIKRENLEVIALTNSEFETLYQFDLSKNKKLAHVRDIFCFACTTGLRYSDLNQLRREHIKEDELRLTVKKTKEPLMVPLNSFSKALLSKYKELHRPLPIISNQKLNTYLKELCKLAAIDDPVEIVRFRGAKREASTYPKYELISVHTGRKTFATLSLERGMSAEEVMTITGHKDYKSFKRYIKITEERKKIAMNKAWNDTINQTKIGG